MLAALCICCRIFVAVGLFMFGMLVGYSLCERGEKRPAVKEFSDDGHGTYTFLVRMNACDWHAVQTALASRQAVEGRPPAEGKGESNVAGILLADICREWQRRGRVS